MVLQWLKLQLRVLSLFLMWQLYILFQFNVEWSKNRCRSYTYELYCVPITSGEKSNIILLVILLILRPLFPRKQNSVFWLFPENFYITYQEHRRRVQVNG